MPSSAASKTIVIADDTAFVRDRFKAALESAGHVAVLAADAAELLSQAAGAGARPDLILLDLRLPQSSGVALVRTLRSLPAPQAPVVVFSGTVSSVEDVRALAALGVAGYISEYSAIPQILPALAPYLFPGEFNRRSSPRVAIGVPVTYHFKETIIAGVTLNVCRSGLAVRTTSPLASGDTTLLRFRLPARQEDLSISGRVCWSDARVGMGLRLEQLDPAVQRMLDVFVDDRYFHPRP